MATRIGLKMGLHRTCSDNQMPFFEQEMRLRVWWQIMSLEWRARRKSLGLSALAIVDFGDMRMPLNINDADLHSHMANPPAEHIGATEMIYCLMKYEILNYIRSWLTVPAVATSAPYELVASTTTEGVARKRKVLADLEQLYNEKYLCHCDPSIPLQRTSSIVAQLTLHRLRFWYYHPRHQKNEGRYMSYEDREAVFESSVLLLQLDFDLRASNFSAHLLEPQLVSRRVEALVYMISELRQRLSGETSKQAWSLVEKMYEEYPELLQEDGRLFTALADLTWKAWDLRSGKIEASGSVVPKFIMALQQMRGDRSEDILPAGVGRILSEGGDFQFGAMYGDPLDWVYWDEYHRW